ATGTGVGIGRLIEKRLQFLRALAGAKADADRVRRIALVEEIGALLARDVDRQTRRPLAVFLVDPGHPQIGRLVDMRIGGNQAIIRHGVPSLCSKRLVWSRCPIILTRSAADFYGFA